MDERTQGALLLAIGGIALRLGVSDAALAYVKAIMQPFLFASGVVLVLLGAGSLLRAFRRGPDEDEIDPAEDHAALHGFAVLDPEESEPAAKVRAHAHAPASAWLLVLPLLALLLIAPPPLGSFAAERQSVRPPTTTTTAYPPLPAPVEGAVDLSLRDYIFRALYDEERSLDGERVRLAGFVSGGEEVEGYLLTRFVVACCAADATAVTVEVVGDRDWPADTWLEVEGRWEPRPEDDPEVLFANPPLLRAEGSRQIDQPVPPYEY